jgi:8-oxo-dGTP pyrophosphatase MutT (NUDIX family)
MEKIMNNLNKQLILGSLLLVLAGCAGSGGTTPGTAVPAAGPAQVRKPAPVPAPTAGTPAPAAAPAPRGVFTFQPVAPHAAHLPFDAQDEAIARPGQPSKLGGAGVFVYTTHRGQEYVLLARRAKWLRGPGEWGVFGGGVEAKDTDAAGKPCYARAAEHELYEETVSVYHETDANALRACPSHLKTFRSGWRFRTFFSRQPYRSADILNQGYRYAEQQPLGHAFRENDKFRWVLLEDLKASALAKTATAAFTDVKGAKHTLVLHGPFFAALTDAGYLALLNTLP